MKLGRCFKLTWITGVHDGHTWLPEMPPSALSAEYEKMRSALDMLYASLSEPSVLTTPLFKTMPSFIWLTLPSGLMVLVAQKGFSGLDDHYEIVNFRMPAYVRVEHTFVFMKVSYKANLYPGQTCFQNFFYNASNAICISSSDARFTNLNPTLKWADNTTKDYTLNNVLLDIGAIALYAVLLGLLVKVGFTAVQSLLDALLHSKVDAQTVALASVNTKVDTIDTLTDDIKTKIDTVDQTTVRTEASVNKIYRGSYV